MAPSKGLWYSVVKHLHAPDKPSSSWTRAPARYQVSVSRQARRPQRRVPELGRKGAPAFPAAWQATSSPRLQRSADPPRAGLARWRTPPSPAFVTGREPSGTTSLFRGDDKIGGLNPQLRKTRFTFTFLLEKCVLSGSYQEEVSISSDNDFLQAFLYKIVLLLH